MGDCGTNCQETLREIERFLDRELDSPVRSEIERHLGDCHPCAERTDFQRHVKALIASKCGYEHVPPELLDRITTLLDRQDAPGA